MQKWEYTTLDFDTMSLGGFEQTLNNLGNDGWEAVCVISTVKLLLKRPKVALSSVGHLLNEDRDYLYDHRQ